MVTDHIIIDSIIKLIQVFSCGIIVSRDSSAYGETVKVTCPPGDSFSGSISNHIEHVYTNISHLLSHMAEGTAIEKIYSCMYDSIREEGLCYGKPGYRANYWILGSLAISQNFINMLEELLEDGALDSMPTELLGGPMQVLWNPRCPTDICIAASKLTGSITGVVNTKPIHLLSVRGELSQFLDDIYDQGRGNSFKCSMCGNSAYPPRVYVESPGLTICEMCLLENARILPKSRGVFVG